jgi:hypothetical protein
MTRPALVSLLTGLLLLVGAPTAWHLGQPADTVGDVAAASATPEPRPDRPVSVPGSDPELDLGPTDEHLVPELAPTAPAGPPPDPEPAAPAVPTGVSIPAIDVDAPIDRVGLEDDGGMEIPHDIRRIGWYEPGVEVGAAEGTAVLSGHVDSREQGRGAFWGLRELDVDDLVTVDHEDGTSSEWRVVARTVYSKDELPIADIFTRFGDPGLVLITCGGAFDDSIGHYEDNVVVYTEPAEPLDA